MPVLSNPRHERFCQLLLEGLAAVDAHEKAGYKRNDGNASTLAQRPDVQSRLKELKGKFAARAGVTAESLMNEAEEARVGAMENRQFSAAVRPTDVKAKISGLLIERVEVGPPGAFDTMTDDELERALLERLRALGLTPDAGTPDIESTPDTESDTRH